MNKIISSKITALTFGILVVCFAIAFYVVAWQEPTQAPPGGNVPTPLNVSATAQTKEGDLTINGVLKTLKDMIVNAVTIKGNSSVSPNLNSDKLDDYHAADLLAGGAGAVFAIRCPWTTVGVNPASCAPAGCPSGWLSSNVGCVATGYGISCGGYAGGGIMCGTGVSGYTYGLLTGYCERYCYK